MNIKRASISILTAAIASRFLLFILPIVSSVYSYGEELHKTDDSILFTFMRDNYKLEAYAAALGANIKNEDDPVLAGLPFRELYHKLQKELLNLALAEAKDAISKNDITEEMQRVMNGLITDAGGGFDRAILSFREKFKDYPNTADLVSLTATSIHDAKEIFELTDAFKKEGSSNAKEMSKELLTNIFNNELDNYKTFIEQNKEAFEIISKLADNGFRFEDITVECKSFFTREVCETQTITKEIKNFSEIMPYVMAVQERKGSGIEEK